MNIHNSRPSTSRDEGLPNRRFLIGLVALIVLVAVAVVALASDVFATGTDVDCVDPETGTWAIFNERDDRPIDYTTEPYVGSGTIGPRGTATVVHFGDRLVVTTYVVSGGETVTRINTGTGRCYPEVPQSTTTTSTTTTSSTLPPSTTSTSTTLPPSSTTLPPTSTTSTTNPPTASTTTTTEPETETTTTTSTPSTSTTTTTPTTPPTEPTTPPNEPEPTEVCRYVAELDRWETVVIPAWDTPLDTDLPADSPECSTLPVTGPDDPSKWAWPGVVALLAGAFLALGASRRNQLIV